MKITRSQEDYLEAIFVLEKKNKFVRVSDIAKFLNVKMASVAGMLRKLSDRELVVYKRYERVSLTPNGNRVAKATSKKHLALKGFLHSLLGVPEETASKVACHIEHSLEEDIVNKLSLFLDFIKQCPRCGNTVISHFNRFLKTRKINPEECSKCICSFSKYDKEAKDE